MELIIAVTIGIGLAASAGFRVFVPLFVASLAAHFGVLPAQEGFAWLASWPAMLCFGTATIVEIVAYYVPYVDHLLDTITTPLSIGAGTLLLTSVLPIDNNLLRWTTGFIVGGGAAATVQIGTVLTRLTSLATTGGIANPVVATAEHTAAVGTSVLSLLIPLVVVSILLLIAVGIIIVFRKRLFGRSSASRLKATASPAVDRSQ